MRRRSKTNSRPQENLPLRREYLDRYPYDEAWKYLCEAAGIKFKAYVQAFGAKLPSGSLMLEGVDPHHIHGGYTGRWDLWSEIISVCRGSHVWIENHPVEGKVICLYAKWRKAVTGNPEDFDLEELHKASGKCYPSVLETYDVSGKAAEYRDEMVEWFRDIAKAERRGA